MSTVSSFAGYTVYVPAATPYSLFREDDFLDNIDVRASIDRWHKIISEVMRKDFPGCDVLLTSYGTSRGLEYQGILTSDMIVQEIEERVWSTMDWIVYK